MSVICNNLETTIVEAIDASVRETFSMMIDQDVNLTQQGYLRDGFTQPRATPTMQAHPNPQITVIVGLSGELQGSVSICLDQGAALDWTKRLIDHESQEVDQEVVDAVGELGNMIVGGGKGRLQDCPMKLGLPCVLLTGRAQLVFPTKCQPLELRYDYEAWKVDVFVALMKGRSTF